MFGDCPPDSGFRASIHAVGHDGNTVLSYVGPVNPITTSIAHGHEEGLVGLAFPHSIAMEELVRKDGENKGCLEFVVKVFNKPENVNDRAAMEAAQFQSNKVLPRKRGRPKGSKNKRKASSLKDEKKLRLNGDNSTTTSSSSMRMCRLCDQVSQIQKPLLGAVAVIALFQVFADGFKLKIHMECHYKEEIEARFRTSSDSPRIVLPHSSWFCSSIAHLDESPRICPYPQCGKEPKRTFKDKVDLRRHVAFVHNKLLEFCSKEVVVCC